MNFLDILLKRRSIRRYTDEPVPEEKLEKIIQAALLSPTSRDLRPWEFYVVRDRETLRQLAKAKNAGAGMLASAGAAIVVFADPGKADTWIEDSSIALTCMHLMAAEQGVGSCWIQLHMRKTAEGGDAEARAREILGVPEHWRTVGIMSLGMPSEEREPAKLEDMDLTKVHWKK